MGRYRKPGATTRKRRNHTDRVAREARLDDAARSRLGHSAEQMIVILDETTDDEDEWDYR